MMRVVWFRAAVRDLESARDYIQDNPQAARQIVSRIREVTALLGEHPGIGRPGRVPDTKELVVDGTPFILPYRVRDNRVEILRVLHASRRWPTER